MTRGQFFPPWRNNLLKGDAFISLRQKLHNTSLVLRQLLNIRTYIDNLVFFKMIEEMPKTRKAFLLLVEIADYVSEWDAMTGDIARKFSSIASSW